VCFLVRGFFWINRRAASSVHPDLVKNATLLLLGSTLSTSLTTNNDSGRSSFQLSPQPGAASSYNRSTFLSNSHLYSTISLPHTLPGRLLSFPLTGTYRNSQPQ